MHEGANSEFLTKRELARLCRCSERTIDRLLEKAMRRRSRSYPLDELSFQLHQRGNGLRAGPRVTLKMMPTDRCPLKKRRPRPLLRFWGRRAMFRLRVELALSLTHPRSRHKLSLFAPS